MKKRRIKKSVIRKGIFLIILFVFILIMSFVIKTIRYHKTDEYKLLNIGYTKEEIGILLSSDIGLNYALNNEYNSFICDFINEKYYIDSNLERYLNYKKENNSKSIDRVVSIVNVNADRQWYSDVRKTDTSKGNLMLVNKFNYLDSKYMIDNVTPISSRYAYSDNYSNDEIMSYYKKMFKAAEKDGFNLIISSGFRDYEEQDETYNYYKNKKGEEYANNYAAKAGFSEHQSGLAFDILTTGVNTSNFAETDEFIWLKDNSYKYGFIMRYPLDKEEITGYKYEPWHYRYVGIEVAKVIYEENITFDEYYAYYIEGK